MNNQRYKIHFHQKEEDPLKLHSRRRLVSTYYQHLSFLYFHRLIPCKYKRKLPGIDLSIIEFLYPIEEFAIGEAIMERNERTQETPVATIQEQRSPDITEPALEDRKPKWIPEGKKPMYKMYNERFNLKKSNTR